MKQFHTILIALTLISISCQKDMKPAYTGQYIVKSKTIEYTLREQFTCGYIEGFDTLQTYPIDTTKPEPIIYSDTTYSTDTILVTKSENSNKEFVITGLINKHDWDKVESVFYKPANSSELIYLNSSNNWKSDNDYPLTSYFDNNQIDFNFKTITSLGSSLTFTGLAKKID